MELFVARNGQQSGPYDEARVRDMLARGEVSAGDLAWHSGLSGWQPLSTLFPSAPPAPVVTAPAPPAFPPPPAMGGGVLPAPMMMPPGGAYGDPSGAFAPLPAGQQLASLGARLGGAIIDSIFALICSAPGFAMLFGSFVSAAQSGQSYPSLAGNTMGWGALGLGILVNLAVQGFLIASSGQSIGKKVAGTRIVKLDGSLPGLVHGYLLRGALVYLIGLVPYLGRFFGLVDACFIFRQDRRCIHDLIASTRVVNA